MTSVHETPGWLGRSVGRFRGSRLAKQTAGLAGASIVASVLSLVATAIVARSVSAEAFGAFVFAVALLGFVAMFFEFGVYGAASRMAAMNPADRREIVGAALVLYVPIGLGFVLTTLALTPVADRLLESDLGAALAVAAVLGLAYPFAFASQELAKGADRLHIASGGMVAFPVSFVGLLALLALTSGGIEAGEALVARSVALVLVAAFVAAWLRPAFERLRETSIEILRQTRRYGLNIYVGRILSVGTYNMDVLLVGVWAATDEVGYYALAVAIAGAAGLPVIALSNALFPRLAVSVRIEQRWLVLSVIVGTVLAVAAYLVARPFIVLVFSERYRDVVPLLVPLLAAQAVRGTTALYNVYLAAHGRGQELRNAGLVLTVSNLGLNFALIPPFGATGAAWASLVALVANLAAHVIFYRRSVEHAQKAFE